MIISIHDLHSLKDNEAKVLLDIIDRDADRYSIATGHMITTQSHKEGRFTNEQIASKPLS